MRIKLLFLSLVITLVFIACKKDDTIYAELPSDYKNIELKGINTYSTSAAKDGTIVVTKRDNNQMLEEYLIGTDLELATL